mmetsp:Transcript_17238/g.43764  ORF Transcript_17238/g.43764 Transcript_17238/m.43764 type:complete len:434 (-) Transcript_17238:264-1565(-)
MGAAALCGPRGRRLRVGPRRAGHQDQPVGHPGGREGLAGGGVPAGAHAHPGVRARRGGGRPARRGGHRAPPAGARRPRGRVCAGRGRRRHAGGLPPLHCQARRRHRHRGEGNGQHRDGGDHERRPRVHATTGRLFGGKHREPCPGPHRQGAHQPGHAAAHGRPPARHGARGAAAAPPAAAQRWQPCAGEARGAGDGRCVTRGVLHDPHHSGHHGCQVGRGAERAAAVRIRQLQCTDHAGRDTAGSSALHQHHRRGKRRTFCEVGDDDAGAGPQPCVGLPRGSVCAYCAGGPGNTAGPGDRHDGGAVPRHGRHRLEVLRRADARGVPLLAYHDQQDRGRPGPHSWQRRACCGGGLPEGHPLLQALHDAELCAVSVGCCRPGPRILVASWSGDAFLCTFSSSSPCPGALSFASTSRLSFFSQGAALPARHVVIVQ